MALSCFQSGAFTRVGLTRPGLDQVRTRPHEGAANPDPPHDHGTAPPGPNLMLNYSTGCAANRNVSAISRSLGRLSALDSLS